MRLNGNDQMKERSEMGVNYSIMDKKQTEMDLVSSSARSGIVQQPEGVTLQKYPQTRLLLILVEEVV